MEQHDFVFRGHLVRGEEFNHADHALLQTGGMIQPRVGLGVIVEGEGAHLGGGAVIVIHLRRPPAQVQAPPDGLEYIAVARRERWDGF